MLATFFLWDELPSNTVNKHTTHTFSLNLTGSLTYKRKKNQAKQDKTNKYPNWSWESISEFETISEIRCFLCSPTEWLRHFWSTQQPWRSVASSTQLAAAASKRNCSRKLSNHSNLILTKITTTQYAEKWYMMSYYAEILAYIFPLDLLKSNKEQWKINCQTKWKWISSKASRESTQIKAKNVNLSEI